jgi:hypothetical protein
VGEYDDERNVGAGGAFVFVLWSLYFAEDPRSKY